MNDSGPETACTKGPDPGPTIPRPSIQPPAEPAANRFVFLDYLRAMAAWAVVWDHLFCAWPAEHGVQLGFVGLVRTYVTQPLGIIQDFGWMAVAIFFLVSGFIITHVAMRENVGEFLIKRFFRVFPMLAVFVLLVTALSPTLRAEISLGDLLRNMTLVNYFFSPQVITVGVAWTLVIEVIFYLLVAATLWTGGHGLKIAINLVVPTLVIFFSRNFGPNFFLFAASMAYVPYLVVGQILYFSRYRRNLGMTATGLWLVGCLATVLYGITSIHTAFLPVTNSYLINFIYSCVIFCVLFSLNRQLPPLPVVRFLADTSFAVYLVHGVLGRAAFDVVAANWGIRLAVLVGLVVTMAAATIVHFVLERPSLAAGRRIARQFRSRPMAAKF